jgi:peptidoglycan hydrolase-like protein with peptidoglycan-binding domain
VSTTPSRRLMAGAALAAALALGLASCSSDSATSTTNSTGTTASPGTTVGTTSNTATAVFTKAIQEQLKTVGCYAGAVDGKLGPETDAAIVNFQKASGLETDGELGPETESALKADVAANKTVCTSAASSTTATTAGGGGTTTTAQAASTSTSTTPSGGTAPCTATAVHGALATGGIQLDTYVCSEGWAAGTYTVLGTTTPTKFILQSVNGTWQKPAQDPCGAASAGLPPVILQTGC